MNRFRPVFGLGLLLPALAVTGACDDEEADVEPPIATAEIRVVHASPDAPAVDIYVAGSAAPVISDLGYGDASPYLTVDAGSYDFAIRPAGSPADTAPAFSTGPTELADGARVTAIAAGRLGSTDAGDRFRVLVYAEQFDPAPADSAIARIVHASADAPTVAVDVGNDGSPEIASIGRFEDTGPAGVALPAGTPIAVGIWAGDPAARVTAFTTPALPDGAELFVVATGLLAQLPRQTDGFSLLAVAPDGAIGFVRQDPVVFALHASPNAPAVDIYAGDAQLVEGIAFGELTAPIQVPPASYELDFYETGTGPGTPAASAQTPSLEAGERYLAIASGFLGGDPAFSLIPVVDAFDPADRDNARIGVVHASPDAPPVDVSTVTGGQMDAPALVTDIAFAEAAAGAGLSVPPSELTVGVAATGSASPVATFDLELTAGLRAFAVAAGALAPVEGEEPFRLIVIATDVYPWVAAEVIPNP